MNKVFKIFGVVTIISLILLVIIINNSNNFKNNPLSQDIVAKIDAKNHILKQTIRDKYNLDTNIPIVITDIISDNQFGMATYRNGYIEILLNKNRFQENENYMIDYVLPHEYAHALMFYIGDFTKQNGGHTKRWEQICLNIGGLKCDRFVKHNDILIEKLPFLKN
ncbi:MAG: SprT-like domain-containing protein [Campylobacterota bacterium]|nr:SprT-like domain-containing protein [Campylobacterota bacterium]